MASFLTAPHIVIAFNAIAIVITFSFAYDITVKRKKERQIFQSQYLESDNYKGINKEKRPWTKIQKINKEIQSDKYLYLKVGVKVTILEAIKKKSHHILVVPMMFSPNINELSEELNPEWAW